MNEPWDMATCDYYLQVGTKSCTNPTGSCAFFGYPECHDLGAPTPQDPRRRHRRRRKQQPQAESEST